MVEKVVVTANEKEVHTTDDVLRRVVALAFQKLHQNRKPGRPVTKLDQEAERVLEVLKKTIN